MKGTSMNEDILSLYAGATSLMQVDLPLMSVFESYYSVPGMVEGQLPSLHDGRCELHAIGDLYEQSQDYVEKISIRPLPDARREMPNH